MAATVALFFLSVGLAGCPVAADLENPTRFDALAGSTGVSGTSGVSGGAGTSGVDCNQMLPDEAGFGCTYRSYMTSHCARGGCHNTTFKSAGLDLTPNDLLIARILDQPATHSAITCSGSATTCDPATKNCANCMACVAGDLLVSSTNFADSWMVKKMDAFDIANPGSGYVDMMCGTAMPYTPGNTGYTAERRDCLKQFFQWIATNGRKCDLAPAGGGMGGGGAGGSGAGTGGAGTGGTGGT